MKVLVLVLTLFVTPLWSKPVEVQPYARNLTEVWDEFWQLIPVDECVVVMVEYAIFDEEVAAVFDYILSSEFKVLLLELEEINEFITYVNYLQESGADILKWINYLHQLLELPPYVPPKMRDRHKSMYLNMGGLRAMIEKMLDLIPQLEIELWVEKKMDSNLEFKAFVDSIRSDYYTSLVVDLLLEPMFQQIMEYFHIAGVDLIALAEFVHAINSWFT